ncbi:splicing factor 3B subunit 1 isoform X4 [Lethenteron reissneri]|uniref:splicing factor 3B subunit 1 isoform X4 n=1 Tax=Lethenteron reissneri TaxID=7753 RepID=UPI002AB6E087|nr:splicing factor 3B subunit 1 isoform X4 [Lethenteron reissneri]XP_061411678.1 splicing factor 3B subunit 1 isoform X4 [Lethenteron reissneri]
MASVAKTREDIEAQIREIQGKRKALDDQPKDDESGVGLDSTGFFDQEIYGGSDSRFTGYVTSIAANEVEEDDEDTVSASLPENKRATYHAPAALLNDIPQASEMFDPFAEHRAPRIADRDDEYRMRRRQMIISPERQDPFADAVLL